MISGINIQPFALVYPLSTSGCKNVLLIDNAVKDAEYILFSVDKSTTLPIIYSSTSTKTELLALLQNTFTSIERIGFVFSSDGNIKPFLDCKPFFTNSESSASPYSENVEFILSIIKDFGVKNIDYLACNTLVYSNWVNYYGILTKETGVIVGASNDKTGNIKYGGDWIMENTRQDIEFIYFTRNIEYYSFLLDTIPVWTTTGSWPWGISAYGGYLYVANNVSNTIGKISLTNPSGDNNPAWATTGNGPSYIYIYNGYLYVSNTLDNKIGKISLTNPAGDNNQIWASTGTSTGPEGLAIYNGYLYVANNTSNNIGKISLTNPAGDNNQTWASTGSLPSGLAISNGYIYVANYSNNRIGKISLTNPAGDNNQIWAVTGNGPQGLAIANGYIYVTNFNDNTVGRIDISDPSKFNLNNWAKTGRKPNSVYIDSIYIYVSNSADNTISRYDLPPIPTTRAISMKPLYTDNSLVYYKPGSLASCGIGTVRNSSVRSRKI